MKLDMSDGDRLGYLMTILLMQTLRDKKLISDEDIQRVITYAHIALQQKNFQDFQEDLK